MARKKSQPAPEIELIPIGELTPDPDNVRLHDEANIAAIRSSIREFGFVGAVIVDGDGIVRAGNGTLQAAAAEGLTLIPAIRTDLTGDRARAFAIAHNRTAELARWDAAKLGAQLQALNRAGFGSESHLGFSDDALRTLMKGVAQPDEIQDAEPQLDRAEELRKQFGVESGQVWEIRSGKWVHCPKCNKLHRVSAE